MINWSLSAHIRRVADIPSRHRLRSSVSGALDIRPTRLKTVGDCAFPVAASIFWNELPGEFTVAESLTTFRRQLKT